MIDGKEANQLKEFDFVFSCPPYGNLEIYSDQPDDISTLDYPAFWKCTNQS